MKSDYVYQKTAEIENNIIRIETAKRIIDFLPHILSIESSLRRSALLKSSLFSAKIEGNTLQLEDLGLRKDEQDTAKEKKEVFNILRCLTWIYSKNAPKKLRGKVICNLHKIVMQGISADAGNFRTEPSAIFNQAGIAVYFAPPPSAIPELVSHLVKTTRKNQEHAAVNTALAHFLFEKIHPFLDGNGRAGRLLSTFLLKNAGYDFRGLATFEEYVSDHREAYYDVLSLEKKDITEFVEFFTTAIAVSAENVITLLQNQKKESPEDTLLPRRQEILFLIREQKLVSFDFVKRRFRKVPDSSLHYDLRALLRLKYIKKLGTTRGALYVPK